MGNRSDAPHRAQQQKSIRRYVDASQAVDFFNILTGPELLDTTEAHLPAHRERLYPPTVTLSMFMRQALNEDGSCQRAVNHWAAQRAVEGLSPQSVRTGGYCKARGRLPLTLIQALSQKLAERLSERVPKGWRWQGRRVKLLDGTGLSMPDTPENQAVFPQPSSQTPGVGFPAARLVGVVCLATGGVLKAGVGPLEGKGSGELSLARGLRAAFCPGDIALADALYANYFFIAALQALGVDGVFEQNGSRLTDFRRGERLGVRDHLVHWVKPARPAWMSQADYEASPAEITVREVEVDGRVLVTTLLSRRKVSKRALARLYVQRWHVELDFRNIKTTLGMDVLSCLTPSMIEKEIAVYLLAYNVIRLLMAEAAAHAGMRPRNASFKHTVQLWTEWTSTPRTAWTAECTAALVRLIAQVPVGHRPGRLEPRKRKRRPKPYPWLKVPRAEARRELRDSLAA